MHFGQSSQQIFKIANTKTYGNRIKIALLKRLRAEGMPFSRIAERFGCGIGGGPIDWIIKSRGVAFRHAVELLREGDEVLALDVDAERCQKIHDNLARLQLAAEVRAAAARLTGLVRETPLIASPELSARAGGEVLLKLGKLLLLLRQRHLVHNHFRQRLCSIAAERVV